MSVMLPGQELQGGVWIITYDQNIIIMRQLNDQAGDTREGFDQHC